MHEQLALNGGTPVRTSMLPYGRHRVEDDDIEAVIHVLRSDWLTTGPDIARFEEAFADQVGARFAVAVSSGTAALHAAVCALNLAPGDEVVVPAITFVASANCAVYQRGRPVFADVAADTLLVDPQSVEACMTPRTRAIIAVDYAGQPCEYDALRDIAQRHGLALVDDASHALGAAYHGRTVGTLADLNTFSLHPVKAITTGEVGMITTDSAHLTRSMRIFRNHGITSDHHQREQQGCWSYEMTHLGYNYRLTDFQCALGMSQLRKLDSWLARRRQIASQYDVAFKGLAALEPLATSPHVAHAYHLYVVRLHLERLRADRAVIFRALRAEGIGVNVHYVPVYLHPFYRTQFGTQPGLCPVAEQAYEQILSLPIFPQMTDGDVTDTMTAVRKVTEAYLR